EAFSIMQVRQQIADFIRDNKQGVLVVKIPTGGGKSLGLPWIIKEDILPSFPKIQTIMLEPLRAVTSSLREVLSEQVLGEPVGMKIGNDKGLNYHNERFTVATVGSAFGLIKKEKPNIVILDEFDLDQNGDVAIMHNQLYRSLQYARTNDEKMIVILPSATPDISNAKQFYGEFVMETVVVEDRMFDPDILEIDLGSSVADSFQGILSQYVSTLAVLCSEEGLIQGDKAFRIPKGKNVLCTVPSPMYFEKLERLLLGSVDLSKVEIVNVWSRSTKAEKQKLFSGGVPGMTTIFIATDLIRRGGTPEIYAAFPSGWQVRDFCDPSSGIEGVREERAAQSDYIQDEGRCSRKEKGLVIRSMDVNRPESGMTFLERKPLESFVLNLVHYGNLKTFRWWGDVSDEKIELAVSELKRLKAVQEDKGGYLFLTSLGRAMRGLPGSLRMRSMIFDAYEKRTLSPFMVISAGMSVGGLFANTKNKPEIAEVQAPLLCLDSDYMSVYRVWKKISWYLQDSGVYQEINRAHMEVDLNLKNARYAAKQRIKELGGVSSRERRKRVSQIEEELQGQLALIELGKQDLVEQAIMRTVRKVSGKVAFGFGLYKKAVEQFVQAVIRSVSFLDGKKFSMNGSGEQIIRLDLMTFIDSNQYFSESEEVIAESIHRIVLGGFSDQIWENVEHRGGIGYYYQKVGGDSERLMIFPGSATFHHKKSHLVGSVIELKGVKYLRGIIMLTEKDLIEWLPEVAPHLIEVRGYEMRFDTEKDSVFMNQEVFFGDKRLGLEVVNASNRPEAENVFVETFASGQIPGTDPILKANAKTRKAYDDLYIRSGGEGDFLILDKEDELEEYKQELLGKCVVSKESFVRAVEEGRVNLQNLFLKPPTKAEKEEVEKENPAKIELNRQEFTVQYSEEEWCDEFKASVELPEGLVWNYTDKDAVMLPSGRTVELCCDGQKSMTFSDLREKLEAAQIQLARYQVSNDQSQSTGLPSHAVDMIDRIGSKVEIFHRRNGQVTYGYVKGAFESSYGSEWKLWLANEPGEEGKTSFLVGLFRVFLREELKVFEEKPWAEYRCLTKIGEILNGKISELINSAVEVTTSDNFHQKVDQLKREIVSAKEEILGVDQKEKKEVEVELRRVEQLFNDVGSNMENRYYSSVNRLVSDASAKLRSAQDEFSKSRYHEVKLTLGEVEELTKKIQKGVDRAKNAYEECLRIQNQILVDAKGILNQNNGFEAVSEADQEEIESLEINFKDDFRYEEYEQALQFLIKMRSRISQLRMKIAQEKKKEAARQEKRRKTRASESDMSALLGKFGKKHNKRAKGARR
ncbi:DEAD/DEAH box helicase, partial [Patescibacteria group bacterium]